MVHLRKIITMSTKHLQQRLVTVGVGVIEGGHCVIVFSVQVIVLG